MHGHKTKVCFISQYEYVNGQAYQFVITCPTVVNLASVEISDTIGADWYPKLFYPSTNPPAGLPPAFEFTNVGGNTIEFTSTPSNGTPGATGQLVISLKYTGKPIQVLMTYPESF